MNKYNKYNGWTNRETWLVNLHFELNDKDDIEYAKAHIEELKDDIEDCFLSDFVDFSLINWSELEEHCED